MSPLRELVDTGGPVIIAIMALSVLLYERCFNLLLLLRRSHREIGALVETSNAGVGAVRRKEHELHEAFEQQRMTIGALITAAPLLGLLGTVMGMIGAFDSLADQSGRRSMEGLAQGISEVLVATESGLAVAIPAVLLLYFAHRQNERGISKLTALEARLAEQV
ncbi:MAG: MotA/TolQ/ExbB proton channel family protein [Opitutus sp.]